jgi:hypothetical protein
VDADDAAEIMSSDMLATVVTTAISNRVEGVLGVGTGLIQSNSGNGKRMAWMTRAVREEHQI